jgi:ribosomal protein S18 acetylase RimI-like enzyme
VEEGVVKKTYENGLQVRLTLDVPEDYILLRPASGLTWEILDLQVMSARRKGLGRLLVNLALRDVVPPECRLLWAVTRADNYIAQHFYEEMRFRVVAVLRNFYGVKDEGGRWSVDAVMYGRDIPLQGGA